MNPLEFFRLPSSRRVLERAARCAATPLSLHFIDEGREGTRVAGWGQCAACRHVHTVAGGALACRRSRASASTAAAGRGTPVPFVCHLGFVSVSVAALPRRAPGFVLTFGPYVPAETAGSLEHDALEGLRKLGLNETDDLPVPLVDIHQAAAEAIPEIAAWTAEALSALWDAIYDESDRSDESVRSDMSSAIKRVHRPQNALDDPYRATAIAAAIAGNALPQVREVALAALSEGTAGNRTSIAVLRARAVAIATATLEACERARLDTAKGWNRFHRVVGKLPAAKTAGDLLEWVMGICGALCRHTCQPDGRARSMDAFNHLIESRLADGITLTRAASELGENPSTITRRLQRDFGMSYSQYVGRLRIEKAKKLLRQTKLPVGAVAQRTGFSDVSNFGKLFRKFEGMAPLDYRERYGDR